MTENEPSVTRCMIKRSKFALKMVWIGIKIMLIYSLVIFCVGFLFIYINMGIINYCTGVLNIADTIPGWMHPLLVLIVFGISVCELTLICACLSCFPRIQKFGEGLLEWSELKALVKSKKKEEPLMTEI